MSPRGRRGRTTDQNQQAVSDRVDVRIHTQCDFMRTAHLRAPLITFHARFKYVTYGMVPVTRLPDTDCNFKRKLKRLLVVSNY